MVTNSRRSRQAYSLIEVIIVLAIMGLMMAALLQSMLGIRQYASTAEVQDDLAIESQKIIALIQDDLAVSGWYLPYGSPNAGANDRNDIYFPYVQVQQATKLGTKLPHHNRLAYTVKDWVTIAHYKSLPGSETDATATTLIDAAYKTSFYAPSQELIFLRVFQGKYNPVLSGKVDTFIDIIDFSEKNGVTYSSVGKQEALGIRRLDQWKRGSTQDTDQLLPDGAANPRYLQYYNPAPDAPGGRIYDLTVPGIWLQPAIDTPAPFATAMPLRWETITRFPRLTAATTESPPMINPVELREYSYVVVPNPGMGNRGQLVRAYKRPTADFTDVEGNVAPGVTANEWVISQGDYNPDGGSGALNCSMVVDRVVSDKVDRITFDTFRTDRQPDLNTPGAYVSGLEINQVRVRIFLSKKGSVDIGAPQHRVVEATLTMRSTSDSGALEGITPRVGPGGDVILH